MSYRRTRTPLLLWCHCQSPSLGSWFELRATCRSTCDLGQAGPAAISSLPASAPLMRSRIPRAAVRCPLSVPQSTRCRFYMQRVKTLALLHCPDAGYKETRRLLQANQCQPPRRGKEAPKTWLAEVGSLILRSARGKWHADIFHPPAVPYLRTLRTAWGEQQ